MPYKTLRSFLSFFFFTNNALFDTPHYKSIRQGQKIEQINDATVTEYQYERMETETEYETTPNGSIIFSHSKNFYDYVLFDKSKEKDVYTDLDDDRVKCILIEDGKESVRTELIRRSLLTPKLKSKSIDDGGSNSRPTTKRNNGSSLSTPKGTTAGVTPRSQTIIAVGAADGDTTNTRFVSSANNANLGLPIFSPETAHTRCKNTTTTKKHRIHPTLLPLRAPSPHRRSLDLIREWYDDNYNMPRRATTDHAGTTKGVATAATTATLEENEREQDAKDRTMTAKTTTNTNDDGTKKHNCQAVGAAITEDKQPEQLPHPRNDRLVPGAKDVLCGRGHGSNQHPGNKKYRALIQDRKLVYKSLANYEKQTVSIAIVAAIRAEGGRFLQLRQEDDKDKTAAGTTTWCEIGDKKAREKTSQALREKTTNTPRQLANIATTNDDEEEKDDAGTTTNSTTTTSDDDADADVVDFVLPPIPTGSISLFQDWIKSRKTSWRRKRSTEADVVDFERNEDNAGTTTTTSTTTTTKKRNDDEEEKDDDGTTTTTTTKKRKRNDPNAPKRKRTAYQFFSMHIRPIVRAENPDASRAEITVSVRARWNLLEANDLKEWNDKAAEDNVRYKLQMSLYDANAFVADTTKTKTKTNHHLQEHMTYKPEYGGKVRTTFIPEIKLARTNEQGKIVAGDYFKINDVPIHRVRKRADVYEVVLKKKPDEVNTLCRDAKFTEAWNNIIINTPPPQQPQPQQHDANANGSHGMIQQQQPLLATENEDANMAPQPIDATGLQQNNPLSITTMTDGDVNDDADVEDAVTDAMAFFRKNI